MDRKRTDDFIKDFFEKRGCFEFQDEKNRFVNFIHAGWIDSFGMVELIAHLEKEYSVEFQERHLIADKFQTFQGLSEILMEMLNGKDS